MPETIRIDDIDASGRLRPVEPDHVALIAASIEQVGRLEHPIVVRPAGDGYKLTIGAHRLAAMKSLGWTELTVGEHVVVRDDDEPTAKLAEIDENLVRHDLNALDRALFLAARKRVYLEHNRVHTRGGDRKSAQFSAEIKSQTLGFDFSERFSASAAKLLHMSERAVDLAVLVARKLDPEAAVAIRGTMVERNQQQLLALIELEPKAQRKAAAAIKAGEAKTVAQARVAIGLDEAVANDPQKRVLATLLGAWRHAEPVTRASFMKEARLTYARKGGDQ
ncbi:MAG: ParB/RepB/Spo0J family partition protein [Roseiarcus sp.]